MKTVENDNEQLRRRAMQALIKGLGPDDALRYLELLAPKSGNYTRDRHKWLKGLTLDDIVAQAKLLRRRKRAS
jgi:hypothetical protein